MNDTYVQAPNTDCKPKLIKNYKLVLQFWMVNNNVVPGSTNTLIQEHVALGKIRFCQSCISSHPCLSPLLPLEDILDEGLGLVLHSPDDTGDDRVNLMAESPADSLEDETDSTHKVRDHLPWRFIKKSLLKQSVWLNCSKMSFWFWFKEFDILVYFVALPF